MPVVLIDAPGGRYWQRWRSYVLDELLREGMIDKEDRDLFHVTDDVESAVREITHFYRRYHSSRFVRNKLVIRLNEPLGASAIQLLNDRFSDLVSSGRIRQFHRPLAEEQGSCPDKHRLIFEFNRSSYGRLRLLINAINDAP